MITVQDVFEQFYHKFEQKYSPSSQQAKVAKDVMQCRTSALGGRVLACEECGSSIILYNSCRNRHCNLCQNLPRMIWVDKRNKDVLDAPYFHVVLTIPAELRTLVYQNQELLYRLMYKTVAETLFELSQDPEYLGAQIGFMSIIHTWAQDLNFHPHLHLIVMAGGLTATNQWRAASKKFFIPVKVLSKKFRGKYLDYIEKYYEQGLLSFYGNAREYENPQSFVDLLSQCYRKNWYSYTKKTFSGPEAVIRYLARYTHRVAISNERIIAMDDRTVTISVKDRKNGNKQKTVTLQGVEFVRRFLMHVLPGGFVKIRYYGLLANRNKKTKLKLCRRLTNSPTYRPKYEGLETAEILSIVLGRNIMLCPDCKEGKLRMVYAGVIGAVP